jgi:N-acetylneuraminate synthase
MRPSFHLGARAVGGDAPCLVIGEVAQTHDGSLGQAHAFIDAVANAGADAIKFQTHLAAAESTPAEPWRVKFSRQDESRYAYWRRMEFTEGQWVGLKEHATERGLLFLSSPFAVEAVDLLSRVGVPAWKVASGEVNNAPLIDCLLDTKLPLLVSSGMSALAELDAVVARAAERDVPIAVLQCTTQYPCPPERIGLNVLALLRARYGCPVGLSDHSGTIYAGLAAVAVGCEVLEVHVTLSREMFGPDVPVSVTTAELRQLVDGVRFIERMRQHPVDKDAMAGEMGPVRALFTKSVVARTDLPAGIVLGPDDLAIKKPGTGIPAADLPRVIGRRLRRPVPADAILQEDDLSDA